MQLQFGVTKIGFNQSTSSTPFCLTANQSAETCTCRQPIEFKQGFNLLLSEGMELMYKLRCKLYPDRNSFSQAQVKNLNPPLPPWELNYVLALSMWLICSQKFYLFKVLVCDACCLLAVGISTKWGMSKFFYH